MWTRRNIGRPAVAARRAAVVRNVRDVYREPGGRAGNRAVQQALGWLDTRNAAVKQRLIDAGQVQPGEGRGGSVILIGEEAP